MSTPSTLTDAEILVEVRRLTALLGEYGQLLHIAHARWRLNHFDEPIAIAVPESLAAVVVDGARCMDLPLVRAAVPFPTLLVPATP